MEAEGMGRLQFQCIYLPANNASLSTEVPHAVRAATKGASVRNLGIFIKTGGLLHT